ncbi:hypothetical protein [Acidaminococcus fermentans]|uniref:hypothetical protein n=1 Tax=Acidaminococcus fermentans TaxID=905 RepID=UPI003F8A6B9B
MKKYGTLACSHSHCIQEAISECCHQRSTRLEDDLMEVLVQHNVPLVSIRERLNAFVEQITANSGPYLTHPEWDASKFGYFSRVYGIQPFGPCSCDATGMVVHDSEGKIVPHKKLVIGHLGNQELTLDVLDRTDQ